MVGYQYSKDQQLKEQGITEEESNGEKDISIVLIKSFQTSFPLQEEQGFFSRLFSLSHVFRFIYKSHTLVFILRLT